MTLWRLIQRSLQHHWRMHVAVMLGVAIATAVLTGALIVGDSVRGSLRYLALDRLQNIDFALVGDRYFRTAVSSELAADPEFSSQFNRVVAASLLPNITVEPMQNRSADSPTLRRSADVLLIGSDDGFWSLHGAADSNRPQQLPADDEIVLNQPLADDLGVGIGDRVVIRLPTANQVPADSPLGHKENRVRSITDLKIVDVIPATGLGRFRLRSSQQQPHNAYVSLETIGRALDQDGKANALLVSTNEATDPSDPALPSALRQLLHLELGDYGISLERIQRKFGSEEESTTIADFYQITQDRLVFDDETANAVRSSLKKHDPRELCTYLATSIEAPSGDTDEARAIPYSTITAVDTQTARELLSAADEDSAQSLGNNEILLNSWAANDLGARVGDRIVVRFLSPKPRTISHANSRPSFC